MLDVCQQPKHDFNPVTRALVLFFTRLLKPANHCLRVTASAPHAGRVPSDTERGTTRRVATGIDLTGGVQSTRDGGGASTATERTRDECDERRTDNTDFRSSATRNKLDDAGPWEIREKGRLRVG